MSIYPPRQHPTHSPDCSVSTQARSDSNISQPPQNVFPKSWDAFSLLDLTCVTLQMKRERLSTEWAVIVKKSNGASVSISHLYNVDGFTLVDSDGVHWMTEFHGTGSEASMKLEGLRCRRSPWRQHLRVQKIPSTGRLLIWFLACNGHLRRWAILQTSGIFGIRRHTC